ncbi:DUF72 domain-containing protein [Larsenimonas rhizosphaerae]|uniref:DUF72 domain-containing protein n=1 Tax=Larsenimonas rhizosphaerae TaxID=2944682 RepID=A0AA41ZIW3_9GAMM|nr:DUF72 domain-containing protein [Larsenimonas rhizosphaerae]MCM2131196.1 DUF72 domain-containing protein [Larsenimonas rhizosphaerae]MCX2525445.1 DUF72 domain-containing protein [Larsenimonas rhizosphaerae]
MAIEPASSIPLYLGLPMWSFDEWKGSFLARHTPMQYALEEYASVFTAVEGNTTFYSGTPAERTLQQWAERTPDHFRFCFKLPQSLTHEERLAVPQHCLDFLNAIRLLMPKLGPVMIQLPRDFGWQELGKLERLLIQWPPDIPCAVEVRTPEFFHKGEAERALNRLLITYSVDRVMLDVRPLFSTHDDTNRALTKAQQEKPKRPLHVLSTGNSPIIRFIGHFESEANTHFFTPWIEQLALWINQGKTPYLFLHTPDNRRAPELARECWNRLSEHLALTPLPRFPAEQQTSLF